MSSGLSSKKLPPLNGFYKSENKFPPLNGNVAIKIEDNTSPNISPSKFIPSSPKISLSSLPALKISSPLSVLKESTNDKHLEEILSMPFYDIPTLEETLKNTTQPGKRAKIEEMINEKRYLEGRGIKTRGWISRSPQKGSERHQLKSECGDKCFLLPESEKFPICASPKLNEGKSVCAIDCGGVNAALIRARQWGYDDVAAKAEIILEKCNQEGLKNFLPSVYFPPLPVKKESIKVEDNKENIIPIKKEEGCGCGN